MISYTFRGLQPW